MDDENPLEIAKKLGNSIGGMLGEKAFKELELAFVTKLFPKKFSNTPTLRTRQHILLYWRRGFLKTTILREFAKVIPEKFKVVWLSASTTETLLGSVYIPKNPLQTPRIVPPVLAGADFAIITEHSVFLKHGGRISAKLAILNDVLEGDAISTHLIKLGQIQVDSTQKAELEKLEVQFNPDEGSLTYEPDVLMLSCSHPFDSKTLSVLIDSGHFDRFRVIQVEITPEIAKECFNKKYTLDVKARDQLKEQNESLCKVKIKSIETPPHEILKSVYEKVFELTEIPDFRIQGDIIRSISAHMVLRHFSQGNLKEVYTERDYSIEDVNFISERLSSFIKPRIKPLVAGEVYSRRPRKRDAVKRCVLDFVKVCKHQGIQWVQLKAIIAHVQSKIPDVHYQTIINAVNDLVNEGKLQKKPDIRGYYGLVEKEDK